MLTIQELQRISAFEAPAGSQVISLYLGVDLAQQSKDAIKLTARALLKEAEEKLPGSSAGIDHFLNAEHDWQKAGLALFSCPEASFFKTFAVQTPFRNRIRIGDKPYIKPLAHLVEYYANYGAILVDKVGAKFFHFHLGELVENAGTMGEEVRKIKTGQGSSTTGMRGGQGSNDHDEDVARNLRQAAHNSATFFAKRKIRRLFLGGSNDTVAHFRQYLPKQMQAQIAGVFPSSMDVGEHEVRATTLRLLGEANTHRETQLVDELIDKAAKGGSGVVGISRTLHAINEGRVQTLILADGFRLPGYQDSATGSLTYEGDGHFDDESWQPVGDVVDRAVERTLAYGGHVEVVSDNPYLEREGKIGALLRY